jgi:hypothetical protein
MTTANRFSRSQAECGNENFSLVTWELQDIHARASGKTGKTEHYTKEKDCLSWNELALRKW